MAKPDYESVDAYIAAQPEAARPLLAATREAIRAALPEAEEVISYRIPTYKVGGAATIYFAGWKKHYAVYPITPAVLEAVGDAIGAGKLVNNTLQLGYGDPVPTALIGSIALALAAEVAAARAAKER